MMLKLFCNPQQDPQQDYESVLRRRVLWCVGCAVIGALMFFLSTFAFPENAGHAQEFVRGFYSGAGSGMMVVSVIFLIRTLWLLKNPKARRTAQIKETDERQKHITMRTFSTASMVCFCLTVLAIVISAPLNFTVFITLLVEFWISTIVTLVVSAVYNKRL